MWTQLLLLGLGGIIVLGLSGAEDVPEECSRSRMETCTLETSFFPETKEELEAICPSLIEYHECQKNYEEKCSEEEYSKSKVMLTRMISTLRDICAEDSLLHAAVAGNLKCLKEVFGPETMDICQSASDNLVRLYAQRLNPSAEGEEDDTLIEYRRKGHCLDIFSNTACVVRRTSEKCGPVARGAVLEMFGRLRFFELICKSEYISDLIAIIPLLDISEEEEESLMEAFHLK